MKIRHLALLSALIPAAAFISGCGGGNSNGPTPPTNSTPTNPPGTLPPGTVPSPGAPTFPTITVPETLLRLPGGEIGILNLKRTGKSIEGELRVINGVDSPSSLATGVYPVSGVFSAPSAFNVSNQGIGASKFTLSGNLPRDENSNGNVSFIRGTFSGMGTLLAPNTNIFPALLPYRSSGDLTFSNFSARGPVSLPQFPFDLTPVTPTGPGSFNALPSNNLNDGGFEYVVSANQVRSGLRATGTRRNSGRPRQNLRLEISIGARPDKTQTPLVAGQIFNLAVPGNSAETYFANVSLNLNDFQYQNLSGTLVLTSIDAKGISFELRNVTVANYNSYPIANTSGFPNDGEPLSTFVVNGTFEASGLPTILTKR